MDNQSTEATNYIKQHLAQGHTEAAIRQHFLDNGWTQDELDAAFMIARSSYASSSQKPSQQNRFRRLFKKTQNLSMSRRVMLFTAVVVLVVGMGFAGTRTYASLTVNRLVSCGTTIEDQGSASVDVTGGKTSSSGEKLNSCFEQRFSACKPATVTYTYPDNIPLLGGVESKYTIIGKADGGCSMQSTYPKYPLSADFQNKLMTCTYNNKEVSWKAFDDLSNTQFKGCSGPLYQLLTDSSMATTSTVPSSVSPTPQVPSTSIKPTTTVTKPATTPSNPTSTSPAPTPAPTTTASVQVVDQGSDSIDCQYIVNGTATLAQAKNVTIKDYETTNNAQINSEDFSSEPTSVTGPYGQVAGIAATHDLNNNHFYVGGLSGIVVSAYIQVYDANNQLLATSPTTQFACPN